MGICTPDAKWPFGQAARTEMKTKGIYRGPFADTFALRANFTRCGSFLDMREGLRCVPGKLMEGQRVGSILGNVAMSQTDLVWLLPL
jgi:hypothetical protein